MKALWIFIGILIAGCSSELKIEEEKFFEIDLVHIEMWFDAMPKIESKSRFYINLEFSIKNLSDEEIEIDSLAYILTLSNGEKLSFNDYSFSSKVIHAGEILQLKGKVLSSEVRKQIPKYNRNAVLYLNMYFKIGNKKIMNRIYLKSQEFEIAY